MASPHIRRLLYGPTRTAPPPAPVDPGPPQLDPYDKAHPSTYGVTPPEGHEWSREVEIDHTKGIMRGRWVAVPTREHLEALGRAEALMRQAELELGITVERDDAE